ncbi:FixH family protein [Shewanella sp. D64]|uniref:FixH family protein n=1 Tax=unclassified Shewanella TaxID=196818 RepID=UPI0022BA2C33|nr:MULTISPECIES: FixH family protein [unclassified Shewanella]MEC4724018.1 FixH family protein [Shewanella sp. D64]MEC4736038.1 FixH family protein [Shewanella sp. E94]WBJ98017.1 FixH family protein [Shewanella sp. MTB7]
MKQPQAWYKQFWPWFLIILPLCAVVASVNLLYLAIDNKDALVSEDYYKDGKRINQDLRKIKHAKQLGMQFELQVDDNQLTIIQHGGENYIAALNVEFFHPTIESRDFKQVVTADGDKAYRIALSNPITGAWEVRLEGYDQSWRIQKRLQIADDTEYWLN